MANFSGWIAANREDGPLLESLGVKLGFYDDQFGGFEDCQASQNTLNKLLPYWGEIVWHFKPTEKIISQQNAA